MNVLSDLGSDDGRLSAAEAGHDYHRIGEIRVLDNAHRPGHGHIQVA